MIKKILLPIVFSVIFAIAVFAQPAMQETETAEEIAQEVAKEETAELAAYSGTCGTNLKWTLDNGTLTISGTGNMTNWSSGSYVPWYSYRSSIKSVIIGDSVTSIGRYAFSDCTGLTSVTIGDSVTSMGSYAFYKCTSLTEINWNAKSVNVFSSSDYVFAYAGQNGNGINVVFGDNVEKIPAYAFDPYSSSHAPKIVSVTIGDSVTSIGNSAFEYCTSLASIEIPDSVTSIGNYAFYDCTSLTSVTIGDSVTSIGNYAFYDCANINMVFYNGINEEWNKISIGSNNGSLTNANRRYLKKAIRYNANGGNGAPTVQSKQDGINIFLSTTIPTRTGYTFLGWSTTSNGAVEYNPGDTYINNEPLTLYAVWYLPLSGTCGENVTWSISENNVLTISGSGAMTNYSSSSNIPWYASRSNITEVVIGGDITSVGSYAFYDCTSLESIEIPSGVTSIGNYAFGNCTSLVSIDIPDSVTSIGSDAFYYCSKLKAAYYAGTLEQWNSISIGSGNSYLTNAVVTDNKYKIIYNANNGEAAPEIQYPTRGEATNLSLEIPNREGYEFLGWSTAKDGEVEYAPGAEYLGKENIELFAVWTCNAQGNCGFNLKWKMYGTKLTITGTGSMANWSESTSVPWSAYKDEIETVFISDGVTSIGSYAFSDCENLKTVTFTETVKKINSHAFDNATSIEAINFTGSLGDLESIEISGYNDSFMNGSFNFDYVITYTITYNTLGGMSDIQEQSKNHGEPTTLSTEVPTRIGHAFLGWSVEQGGEIVYNAGDEYTDNADIVLYAVWEEVKGDVSGDGELTQEDMDIIIEAMFGKELTEEEFKYANVYDEDDVINIKDLIALAQMLSQSQNA